MRAVYVMSCNVMSSLLSCAIGIRLWLHAVLCQKFSSSLHAQLGAVEIDLISTLKTEVEHEHEHVYIHIYIYIYAKNK